MVAGPELSRLIAGYEAMSGVKDAAISSKHHEQTLSAQRSFLEKAEALHTVLRRWATLSKKTQLTYWC